MKAALAALALSLIGATTLAEEPAAPAAEPQTDSPEALSLARKVQQFYEKTRDYAADFQQVFKYKGSARKVESTGTVQVKKPGLMRWDYVTPGRKLFVLDGKSLYMYDLEDKELQVKKNFSSDTLSAAVRFLWGKGSLVDSFHITKVDKPKLGTTVIELVPKQPEGGFSHIYFVVDADTGAVTRSVIFDTAGNENKITFLNPKTNQGIPDSRFKFQKPRGVHETVID